MGLMMMLHHTQLRWLDKSSKCVELNPCNASAASDLVVVHSSLSLCLCGSTKSLMKLMNEVQRTIGE